MPLAITTFYYQPGNRLADGRSFYGGNRIAAPRRFPFGTVLVFTYRGRMLRAVVADRGGAIRGQHFDIPRAAFASLVGSGWRRQGVARVGVRVVIRPKKVKRGNR